MSDSNYNRDQLINTTYNKVRELESKHDDLLQRVAALVIKMEEFRTQAIDMLTQMSQAHKPQERDTTCQS